MTQPYIGQILIFGFNFAPRNYAFCNGGIQSISQNTALFSILGTTYGGNGQTTFALPNIQEKGVLNIGQGPGLSAYSLGEASGQSTVTLSAAQIPVHNHQVVAYPGTSYDVAPSVNGWLGDSSQAGRMYSAASTVDQAFAQTIMINTGGSQPHENMQPYLAMNYCIALYGIFPSRN